MKNSLITSLKIILAVAAGYFVMILLIPLVEEVIFIEEKSPQET